MLLWLTAAEQKPFIVKIIEPPRDPTGLSEVIVQAIGFTGAVTLAAVLLGVLMAAVLFWIRSRRPLDH
jgi:hypothetical protein